MGKEATLWQWFIGGIRTNVPEYALRSRIDRVENVVVVGMPDVSCTLVGVDVWIENKAVTLPVRDRTRVLGTQKGVNVDQIAWHRFHQQCGGRSFIFIHAAPYRWLIDGKHASEVNEWSGVRLSEEAAWQIRGNMKPENWRYLFGALRGGPDI